MVKLLLRQGKANSNVQNPETSFTPLHWASIHGADNIVNELLKSGARQYTVDKRGLFPVDYAGMFKRESTVQILIEDLLQKLTDERNAVENYLQGNKNLIFNEAQGGKFDNVMANRILRSYWEGALVD